MDEDFAGGTERLQGKLVRYSARGRHYSPAARLQIVEESYTTGARVEDTALLYPPLPCRELAPAAVAPSPRSPNGGARPPAVSMKSRGDLRLAWEAWLLWPNQKPNPQAHPKPPSFSMKIVDLDALVLGSLSLLPYCRISRAALFVLHFRCKQRERKWRQTQKIE